MKDNIFYYLVDCRADGEVNLHNIHVIGKTTGGKWSIINENSGVDYYDSLDDCIKYISDYSKKIINTNYISSTTKFYTLKTSDQQDITDACEHAYSLGFKVDIIRRTLDITPNRHVLTMFDGRLDDTMCIYVNYKEILPDPQTNLSICTTDYIKHIYYQYSGIKYNTVTNTVDDINMLLI